MSHTKGDISGINGSFGSPEKSLAFILVKQKQNIAWDCITAVTIVICLLKEKKSIKLKVIRSNKNVNFPTQFCLGSICNKFDVIIMLIIMLNVMCMRECVWFFSWLWSYW